MIPTDAENWVRAVKLSSRTGQLNASEHLLMDARPTGSIRILYTQNPRRQLLMQTVKKLAECRQTTFSQDC